MTASDDPTAQALTLKAHLDELKNGFPQVDGSAVSALLGALVERVRELEKRDEMRRGLRPFGVDMLVIDLEETTIERDVAVARADALTARLDAAEKVLREKGHWAAYLKALRPTRPDISEPMAGGVL